MNANAHPSDTASLTHALAAPSHSNALVVGGGTMGADVAQVLARAGCRTVVVEQSRERRDVLEGYLTNGMAMLGASQRRDRLTVVSSLDAVDWPAIDLVIECVPERLAIKQALFAELVALARADAFLCSNSSSFPISDISRGLGTAHRMFGLHFFMPAHLVPLVEVVLGARSDARLAQPLSAFMRACGMVPVLVRKDLPGFLANRLQHALAREAFALIDQGIATPEDVDAAVRFGFGFRFLAAGPVLQRDHAGLDVHSAAAATIYPSLAVNIEPARVLLQHVADGHLGMKSGQGFFTWSEEAIARERQRYDSLLREGLKILSAELPPINDK